jgi:hypothetical protein
MKQKSLQKIKNTKEQTTSELSFQSKTIELDEILSGYALLYPIVIKKTRNSDWMKKFILSFLFAFCFFSINYAQDYQTGIGLRAGYYNGLTIKHFIGDRTALEGIFASRWKGLEITGLYEIHNHIFDAQGLNWYFGCGGHVGMWNGDNVNWGIKGTQYIVLGVDGILGIEYNFREIPINIGIDWKPAFNFYGYTGLWTDGGALSLRYIF